MTNQNLGWTIARIDQQFASQKMMYAILFLRKWQNSKLLKDEVLLSIYLHQDIANNIKMVPQWRGRHTISNDNFSWQRTRPSLNRTIFDDSYLSSCHIPHRHKFCTMFNFVLFPNLQGILSTRQFKWWSVTRYVTSICKGHAPKDTHEHNLCPLKTAVVVCTSSWRFVWWTVIRFMEISVTNAALTMKGQHILNYPCIKIRFKQIKIWLDGIEHGILSYVDCEP